MDYFPTNFVKAFHTGAGLYLEQKRDSRRAVEKIIAGEKKEEFAEQKQPTIFKAVLNSKLPAHEMSVDRLGQDAQMAVMAGRTQ